MSVKRLESIDLWKGITILSVIHIHSVFNTGRLYLPDWTRSLALLIDVPVFFFISGFLLHNSKAKVVFQRMLRQFRRLLSDYLIVSIIALLLALAVYALFRIEKEIEVHSVVLSALSLDPTNSIWEAIPVYGSSMWFLRVYVSLLPIGVLILSSPLKKGLIILPFVSYLIFILTTWYKPLHQPFLLTDTKYASFYLTIFLAGAVFKEFRSKFSLFGLSLVWTLLLGATLAIILMEGGLPDIQETKFPPSSLYLIFSLHSILALCLIVLYEMRKRFRRSMERVRSFVAWCGKHTYRIFLWQGIAASVPFFFVPTMLKMGLQPLLIFTVTLIWNILASLGLTHLHNHFIPIGNYYNQEGMGVKNSKLMQ